MNGRSHQSRDMIVRGIALFEHLTTHVFHAVRPMLFGLLVHQITSKCIRMYRNLLRLLQFYSRRGCRPRSTV